MASGYLAILIILSIGSLTVAFEDNDLYGISHMTQVVSDLQLSTRFYTELLGGMLVPELSTEDNGINGDEHFYRYFYKEYQESLQRNVRLSERGVPDIRARGDHNVRWNFILFNNLLVQLLQFVKRDTRQPFIMKDPRVGNGWVTSTHLAFAADQRVVPMQQVQDFIKRFENFPEMDENKRGFISNPEVESFQQRRSRSLQSRMMKFSESLYVAVFRGPDGERFEILYRRGNGSDNDLRESCRHKGISHEMLDGQTRNKYHNTLSKRMAAFNHLSVVVEDIKVTDQFYLDILGGKKNLAESAPAAFELDEYSRVLVFQDEILEAKETGYQADETFGIPTLAYNTKPMWDYTFLEFDNTYFEPYWYKVNDMSRDPNDLVLLYRNWSSPAYINNNHYSFWVKEDVDLGVFVRNVERQAASRGMNKVFFNRAPPGSSINVYESPFAKEETLNGFNYLYFKGPSGEQVGLSQFMGPAARALQASMEEYGALSTAFSSTNPWEWDGFVRTCERLLRL